MGRIPCPRRSLTGSSSNYSCRFQTSASWKQSSIVQPKGRPHASSPCSTARVLELSTLARQIPITNDLRRHGIRIVLTTHPEKEASTAMARRYVRYGSSPRGAQTLILTAKIRAILDRRYHVLRNDLRSFVLPTLRHCLILNFEGQAEHITADEVGENILEEIEAPAMVV